MKRFLLFFLLVASIYSTEAQVTLNFCNMSNQPINNGDTITVDSLSNVSEMIAHMKVINILSVNKIVTCTKEYQSIVPGSTNTFCFAGGCYPANQMMSDTITIAAQDTNSEFSGHYYPSNNSGVSLIKYTFTVNHGDDAWFYVKYVGTVGIADNYLQNFSISVYPNPASTISTISYNILYGSESFVLVSNICGKIEKKYVVTETNGTLAVNVSDLPAGVYFCSLNVNGRNIKTNRLLVVR